MKIDAKYEAAEDILVVSATENCDTDSRPFLQQLFFRGGQSTFDPEFGAIAAAILFGRHCGSIAAFDGTDISIDAARAIRRILPELEDLEPINGMRREISQGKAALVVGEARLLLEGEMVAHIGKAARVVAWSGDFVEPDARDSHRHVSGQVFTNALLVAGTTEVSCALGLLIGGRAIHELYVPPPPPQEEDDFHRIAEGLEFIGVKLRAPVIA